MGTSGELGVAELAKYVDLAQEYLGRMWLKKAAKATARLPVVGLLKPGSLKNMHPAGIIFREAEKELDQLSRGKQLDNAVALLMAAGLGRNLEALHLVAGFESLISMARQPHLFAHASLAAEVAAHWRGMGYAVSLRPEGEEIVTTAADDKLELDIFCYIEPSVGDDEHMHARAWADNFTYSDWWSPWIEADDSPVPSFPQIIDYLDQLEEREVPRPAIVYIDMPPLIDKVQFAGVLSAVSNRLSRETRAISGAVLCLPQYLPHLYLRHTMAVNAVSGPVALPKSLLNRLTV